MSSGVSDHRHCVAMLGSEYAGMDLIDWIKVGLAKPGKTKGGLAQALGRAQSAVTALLQNARGIRVEELIKMAEYLDQPLPPFLGSGSVPIVGKIVNHPHAGAVQHENSANIRQIALPLGVVGVLCALTVGDRGMPGLAKEGWFVLTGPRQEPPHETQITELCRCGLPDGSEVVRFLNRSRYPHRFDLEGYNEPPLLAQDVVWAETVVQIVTKAAVGLVPGSAQPERDF